MSAIRLVDIVGAIGEVCKTVEQAQKVAELVRGSYIRTGLGKDEYAKLCKAIPTCRAEGYSVSNIATLAEVLCAVNVLGSRTGFDVAKLIGFIESDSVVGCIADALREILERSQAAHHRSEPRKARKSSKKLSSTKGARETESPAVAASERKPVGKPAKQEGKPAKPASVLVPARFIAFQARWGMGVKNSKERVSDEEWDSFDSLIAGLPWKGGATGLKTLVAKYEHEEYLADYKRCIQSGAELHSMVNPTQKLLEFWKDGGYCRDAIESGATCSNDGTDVFESIREDLLEFGRRSVGARRSAKDARRAARSAEKPSEGAVADGPQPDEGHEAAVPSGSGEVRPSGFAELPPGGAAADDPKSVEGHEVVESPGSGEVRPSGFAELPPQPANRQ